MKPSWASVTLDEILKQRPTDVRVGQTTSYDFAGVYCFGRGVFRGQTRLGNAFSYRELTTLRAGDVVYPKLMAWEGAFGVVSKACAGCVVSPEFPVFEPVGERLDPQFLAWYFRRSWASVANSGKSVGTNVRRRRMHPSEFLRHAVPLPPLSEQRRIVARIEGISAQVHDARALRHQGVAEAQALAHSARRHAVGTSVQSNWIPLSRYVAEIENGKSPATEGRPAAPDEWAVLKVGAVSMGRFDELENKALPASFAPIPRLEVKTGDFVMSRANTPDLVGACAIVGRTRPKLMLSDKIFRFLFRNPLQVDLSYLDQALKSPVIREQIVAAASGTSPTMKNISKEKVLNLRLPPHSLPEQRSIVAELNALQAEVGALNRLQAENAAELDALLPAVLDRAFKGEL